MSQSKATRALSASAADVLPHALCRVRWRLGQALLPGHFFRQEFSLRQEWELRFSQQSPPPWGVALLEWDEALLLRGFAKISKLALVFPGGRIAHIPGNTAPTHFDLNATNAARGVEVTLYAHLLYAHDAVFEDDAASESAGLELILQKVELSPERGLHNAIDSVKLATFVNGADGVWACKTTYVPPLLLLSSAPGFFRTTLSRAQLLLQRWQDILVTDIDTHALSTEKVVRAYECLRRSHLLQAFLCELDPESPLRAPDANGAVTAHPHEVYARLRDFAIDVHTYQEDPRKAPRAAGLVYDHTDIAGSLQAVLDELQRRTEMPRGLTSFVPFSAEADVASCRVPEEARQAKEVYWLLHRKAAVREELRGFKLACRSRLETVHRHALKGIPTRKLEAVPFRHSFAPEVEFHQLTLGDEWEHTLRDGTLAYFLEGPAKDGQAYLFWRSV